MPESLGGGETSFKYGMSDFFKLHTKIEFIKQNNYDQCNGKSRRGEIF